MMKKGAHEIVKYTQNVEKGSMKCLRIEHGLKNPTIIARSNIMLNYKNMNQILPLFFFSSSVTVLKPKWVVFSLE